MPLPYMVEILQVVLLVFPAYLLMNSCILERFQILFFFSELTQVVADVAHDPTLPRTQDHVCPKSVFSLLSLIVVCVCDVPSFFFVIYKVMTLFVVTIISQKPTDSIVPIRPVNLS